MTEEKSFADLVLERMDTNPEEFIEGTEKFRWPTLLSAIRTHANVGSDFIGSDYISRETKSSTRPMLEWALDKEEMDALTAKYREVYRAYLKKDYLRRILAGTETEYRYNVPVTGTNRILSASKYLGPQHGNVGSSPSNSIITPAAMRDEALQVLQTAIDREAREGNWGAVPSGPFTTNNTSS
jgi:hypothetical protein